MEIWLTYWTWSIGLARAVPGCQLWANKISCILLMSDGLSWPLNVVWCGRWTTSSLCKLKLPSLRCQLHCACTQTVHWKMPCCRMPKTVEIGIASMAARLKQLVNNENLTWVTSPDYDTVRLRRCTDVGNSNGWGLLAAEIFVVT